MASKMVPVVSVNRDRVSVTVLTPIHLDKNHWKTTEWTGELLSQLNIKVDQATYEPHDLFTSGYVKTFLKQKQDKKISGFIGRISRNENERVYRNQCIIRALAEVICIDCVSVDEIPAFKMIKIESGLQQLEQKENHEKLLLLGSKHDGSINLDYTCNSLQIWLSQFVQQLSLMVRKRKKGTPEEITEGMYQELFLRFIKMFEIQIIEKSNMHPFIIPIGQNRIAATPDAVVQSLSCKDLENDNSIAVIKVDKDSRTEREGEEEGEMGSRPKKLKTDPVTSAPLCQLIGDMMAVLPSSVLGSWGIYGFLVQGTKVTVVSLVTDEGYMENLNQGYVAVGCEATVKCSKECNILTTEGRRDLIQTLQDMTDLLQYLCDKRNQDSP
ncbi:uncharacterized protein LOC134236254 [Saccostrea cucullata]|uniref:uncharacterized protein LOC134236254 n=1 Tax=Saccostrea cuccullata TaxID=36930 RepID=UPI002ED06490